MEATSPGGTPVPRTVVEKVDTEAPSHGEVPGTAAYDQRLMDASPDLVIKAPEPGQKSPALSFPETLEPEAVDDDMLPESIVITRVDSDPAHGKVPGTEAFAMGRMDAELDGVLRENDPNGKLISIQ